MPAVVRLNRTTFCSKRDHQTIFETGDWLAFGGWPDLRTGKLNNSRADYSMRNMRKKDDCERIDWEWWNAGLIYAAPPLSVGGQERISPQAFATSYRPRSAIRVVGQFEMKAKSPSISKANPPIANQIWSGIRSLFVAS
jgi:hypothetical protein